MTDYLFAYGTLQPGLAPPAMRELVGRMLPIGWASVAGRLYHLGAYPGIFLDPTAGPVRGRVLEVRGGAGAWRRLDAYEGFDPAAPARSLFRRVPCAAALDAGGKVDCWVYVYNGDAPEAARIASGAWRPGEPAPHESYPMKHNRRPLIGVTLGNAVGSTRRYELPVDYAASIERAGGIPLALPYKTDLSLVPEILDALDGVLFTGGDDLDPALYGDSSGFHPEAEPVDPDRPKFELALLAEVERRRVPALGVCLGCQLMNVYRGGTLIQFLPDHDRRGALEHRKLNDDGRRHLVRIEPGTVLAVAVGRPEIVANTRHKQAIRRVGKGLRVNAVAPDGVTEGIEDPSMPLFLAVQWHPENLSEQPEHLAPFRLLVEKARETTARCR